jgi:hypothetical protein
MMPDRLGPETVAPLPLSDRRLLLAVGKIVPRAEREEWSRVWQGELWHTRYGRRDGAGRELCVAADLSLGLACDALWLRGESWRRALCGTAILCLAWLAGLCVCAGLATLGLGGGWHRPGAHLEAQALRFMFAAPLVVFVSFATASRRQTIESSAERTIFRIRRALFCAAKTGLLLLLAFLLSVDVCQPVHLFLPNTADLLQILFFVVLALAGLRWGFADQEQRCEQCLRVLASPARVGRPSHNLLEWNGTEQVCRQGHGVLSVPEMESSWRQSSEWVDLTPTWDQPASV